MTQLGFQSIIPPNEPLTVSEVTARIKELVEGDDALADLRVAGELSNVSRPASGHLYFTLKDGASQIRCAMWRSAVQRLRGYTPQNGDAVIARGHVGVYERDGAYQLYVDSLVRQGAGDLHIEFERLKLQLQAEGLFDAARKRPLPAFPRVLGVVTSPTAAAFQDVLNVLRRRYPMVAVVLSPTLVQGEDAPPQIVRAIARLNDMPSCDVILLARGGGSLEELWAFNDERVVRAVAASRVPVVCGVGHEIDYTLADFAADLRAPTPSAAAELIVPNADDLRLAVDALSAQAATAMVARIDGFRSRLALHRRALRLLGPADMLAQQRQHLADLRMRLTGAQLHMHELWRARLDGLIARLASLGPLATLARGYAIVRREDGTVLRSVRAVAPGDAFTVRLADGEFGATAHDRRE
jgi:exodeoxyribonuclease VII large subunit